MTQRTVTFQVRQKRLANMLCSKNIDALLITHLPHIRYLTGFSGTSAMLLLLREGHYVFFTDFRYQEQSRIELRECVDLEILIIKKAYLETLLKYVADKKFSALAFQPKSLTYEKYFELKKKNPSLNLEPFHDTCESIVREKSEWEIEAIADAARFADKLFLKLQQWYTLDLSERVIAAKIEYEGRLLGSEGSSFPSIIASGKNAALPHAQATDRHPKKGEVILADYGQRVKGYCSDMTRTVNLGKADFKTREIYHIVLEAQENALKVIGPGIACAEVDRAARKIIEQAGYGEQFGHGVGHSVGIEVHEGPGLSANSKDTLQKGMVVTVEPGIYIPEWGGVRIEDLVVVTDSGYRNLVISKKELLEIDI